ncbi:MAG TPA: hypothetical protein VM118_09295 [Acidobacteriota bacterium]|nr:hypothetical protein [Acidobacteriota bacterium]
MKRAIVCILLILGASSAHAQDTHRFSFFICPGPSIPIAPQDFSEFWSIGPGLSAGISYAITPALAGMIMLDGSLFTVREDKAAEALGINQTSLDIAGGRITMLSVTGNLKACLTPHASRSGPYVYGGGGLYRLSVGGQGMVGGWSVYPLAWPEDESALGAQFGAGTEIVATASINILIEGRYLIGFTKDESRQTIQLRLGISTR